MYVDTNDLRNLAAQHRDRGNAVVAEAIEAIADVLDNMVKNQNSTSVQKTSTADDSTEKESEQ